VAPADKPTTHHPLEVDIRTFGGCASRRQSVHHSAVGAQGVLEAAKRRGPGPDPAQGTGHHPSTTRHPHPGWWHRGRLGRVAAALAVVVAVTLATQPLAASAHSTLVTSSPAAGAQVSAPVSTVRLTFTAPITTTSAAVTLAVDGAAPRPLTAVVERQDLIATIPAEVIADGARATGPQPWTISYRAVDEDGHPLSDQLTFTVTATRTGASTDAASTPGPARPADPPNTSSPSASSPSASSPLAPPHETGINPHAPVSAERLLGPGLAIGLIAIAALLVVVAPRLVRRPRPSKTTPPDDIDDPTGDDPEPPPTTS
jgi:methionine-rich copper-binding protein CopC